MILSTNKKCRCDTTARGNNLLNTLVSKKGIDFTMPYGTIYSRTDNSKLNKYIRNSEELWKGRVENVPVHALGCTIGAHIEPGAIGVAFFEK